MVRQYVESIHTPMVVFGHGWTGGGGKARQRHSETWVIRPGNSNANILGVAHHTIADVTKWYITLYQLEMCGKAQRVARPAQTRLQNSGVTEPKLTKCYHT